MITFDENTLILTVNARLSEYLRKKYDEAHIQAGEKTWHTLNCFPLNRWVIETTENLPETQLVLNGAQEFALWEKIIAQTNTSALIYHPWKIAEIAQQAWRLLKQWRIPLNTIAQDVSEDIQLFYQWARSFVNACQKHQWQIESDCVDMLADHLNTSSIPLPEKILLAGFDEFTPQIQYLISVLKKHSLVDSMTIEMHPISITRTQYLDEEEELVQMARWAKDIIEKKPEAKIACVAPHLSSIRAQLLRIFTETFASDSAAILHQHIMPFNISAGRAFHEYPLIHAVFEILSLDTKELALNKISALLRSPFTGGAQKEAIHRAQLCGLLYENQERSVTLSTVIQVAQTHALCPIWISQLKHFIQQMPANDEKNNLSIWMEKIQMLLESMGWPGDRNLNSDEYQQWQRWQNVLIEFAQMDMVYQKEMYFYQVLIYLKTCVQKILFQSETQAMPIQILGMLEVAGMTFDYLWVMGMNDDKWPQPAVANPFIPLKLQRQHHMPHASSEREFSFAHRITQRLSQSATHIVFSYSQQKDDTTLRVSKLIQPIEETKKNNLTHEHMTPKKHGELEMFIDDTAPPVSAHEKVRGGTSILKDQAACPFRAFARHRLKARKVPFPVSGLSSQERGHLVHEVLENIWTILKNHDTLQSCEEDRLNKLIHDAISQILYKKAKQLLSTLKKNFLMLEHQTLYKLIKHWMCIEKKRTPFEVISHETVRIVSFEGLVMRLRIDREDKLHNGKCVIIDYKTGTTRIEDWFGERPDDPQLPLYCLTSDHDIDGLIFAQLRSEALRFKGITADNMDIDGVYPIDQQKADMNIKSWKDFEEMQKRVLSKISQDFQAGRAEVDPKKPQETCQFCDLHALCRVYDA